MKKTTRKQLRTIRRRRLALALVGAMAMPMMPALAQNIPNSGSVVNGSATIGQSGNEMTVTQTTKGAIIDWGSFNIGAGYGVTFDQQFGNTSVTLNRVVGFGYSTSASFIDGTLTSNGNVFIINPAGITFGSGAQVNVGGIVASTLNMSNADFLAGLTSGQYRFVGNGSSAGAVYNSGQITTADGGTVGLIGSYIENSGTITANLGSVVFGATNDVTLDFFGDGLTQVTVSGNGLGISDCTIDCTGGITSSGNVFAEGGHIEMRSNTMDGASAGNALFVDPANGGRIWISGNVVARTIGTREGSIIIDAGQGNIDLGGVDGRTGNVSANANNAGENAGTIQLSGNQLFTHLCYGTGPTDLCVANNRLGLVTASAFGAGGSAGEIQIDVNRLYHGGLLQAVANDGSGGLIDITADNAEIYNWVFAYGNNGTGGTINIDANSLLLFRGQQSWLGGPGTAYWSASLLAYGTTTGGMVNIDAGSLVVTDLGNVTPEFPDLVPVINVTGQLGGNGGSITINAGSASIDDTLFADASGEGAGGSIDIDADSLFLDGGLVSTGGTSDGSVSTTTTGSLFLGETAYIEAGTWLVHAPSVDIMSTDDAVSGYGAVLTDDALSATLDGGTVIQLYADASLASGASGNIHIHEGVDIVHATGDAAALDLRATAGIYGSDFSITSTGGPLDLSFTANVAGDNPNGGYLSFFTIELDSNGGDIDMSADGRGVYLEYSGISSGAGDIAIFGSGEENGVSIGETSLTSTGGDISITAASEFGTGARLHDVSIASGGGDIGIDGVGDDGVSITYSDIASADGTIMIDGDGVFSGVYFRGSDIASGEGDIAISGTASLEATGYYPFGVALAGTSVSSTGGDITVVGDAVGGSGLQLWSVYDEQTQTSTVTSFTTDSGAISLTSTGLSGLGLGDATLTTDSGDISLTGYALDEDATAAVFISSGGLTTNGGNITITGRGAATGVWLYEGDIVSNGGDISVLGEGVLYGVQVWENLVSSGSGDIDITGVASGAGAFGVSVRDAALASTSGSITVDGSAANGSGMFFGGTAYGPGSSVTTTSGAISVISTGLSGLSVGSVPFTTDTGDITLEGHALGSGFGVQVGSGGLASNGGDITIIGSSVDVTGVWVNGGDITSNGGDITIHGTSTNMAGTQVSGADITSGGGDIAITGEGASTGLILSAVGIHSGVGSISLIGSGGGSAGSGVSLGQGSMVSTTSGDVSISAVSDSYYAVLMSGDAEIVTASGDIAIEGEGAGGVWMSDGDVSSTTGDIYVIGSGTDRAGIRMDADSSIDGGTGLVSLAASNDGNVDAIILRGSIASTTAVNLRAVDEADTILLGAGNGFSLTSAELALIDAPLLVIGSAEHAGAIRVMEAVDWDDDLTLQNQGGDGGIDLQAAVDVGDNILTLASGGDIEQTSAGAITAHSLLAIASGDVSLTAAQNNVAATSVAGSAGGDFAYEDVDDLAIGEVSSFGFSLIDNAGLTSLSATGIEAEGNVLVVTASGNLTLGADVSGSSIDLVAADLFLNPAGASLTASESWRIFARTPEGEERGGLQGDGQFDVFGCSFGQESCEGIGEGNQFIYQEQRFRQSPIAPESVAELFDEEELDGSVTDLLHAAICPVADAADPLQAGASRDVLGREWLKSRHRLRLNNCIDSNNAPGCRF
ncbi:beta strand repeat-containing protein [Thermomonas carbonis]|uniref:Filamentous hemagglutinin N-terminal domain-containing protein n=1 Tax=Thermomonas carbonis TaxID=1463158 RepID=A0A7G9SPW6_9GAMM|nr:filamentous hemagglutinin N-terminal domain-containing protein [Thermomonas carbonis]QNN69891.1 filamentous hemagglutinin N-terminal domain-containing protein [Thermomonas carbonis]